MHLETGTAETVFTGEIRDQSQLTDFSTGSATWALSSSAYNWQSASTPTHTRKDL